MGAVLLLMIVVIRGIYLNLRRKRNWGNRCESYIEKRLYSALSKKGYYVETQIGCGPYRIDITLPDYGIAIECDGLAFHSSPEQKKHDARKNRYLRKHGWKVMRITGKDINGKLQNVVGAIEKKAFNKNS